MTGDTAALMAVVAVRSYSRYSGRISCERETGRPRARSASPSIASCSGRRKEKSRHTATDSAPEAATSPATRSTSAGARATSVLPR